LAFLRSPIARPILSDEDLRLIEEIIPPTLALYRLTRQEVEAIISNKDRWVLKKSLDTRGRSVVIGKTQNEAEWREAVTRAYQDDYDNYVIQQFEPPEQCVSEGRPLYTSHAYFLLQGKPCGAFTRTSRTLVTNVGSGGSVQVPLIANFGETETE
jgi:glutathionylspermidine synthase